MRDRARSDIHGEAGAARDERERWPFWSPVAVLVVGLLVTLALSLVSAALYRNNEKRLLDLRAREVATVLTAALPSIQTPLASAAALADATHGDPARFTKFLSAYVGQGSGRTFESASLWRVADIRSGPVAVLGQPPALSGSTPEASAFFARASAASNLTVIGMLGRPRPLLGYAYTGAVRGPYAVYAESALPASRYAPVQNNSAFADIDYALYLGPTPKPANLLIATVKQLPLSGRQSTFKVPFGDTSFAVTVAERGPLAGSLPQRLPWAIAIVGVLLSLGAAALTIRLIARRRDAERLARQLDEIARENRRLYSEQRTIAQTLQHALLPDALPQPPGIEARARYEAGVEGVDVGGDWYDLIPLVDGRLLLVVGDVSGRGLRAATTMAALRYAIHAYAAQGDGPTTLLSRLSKLVSVNDSGQLATVLCVAIDAPARELTIASAGHLPPLMIADGRSEYLTTKIGVPVGVDDEPSYAATRVTASAGATLLAFTDGLIERRGESIDDGMERLRAQASSNHTTLDELLTRVLAGLRDQESSDDTAIAGVRWVN